MRASARIVARWQPDGTTRLTTLAGEAPLLLRRTGSTGAGQSRATASAAASAASAPAPMSGSAPVSGPVSGSASLSRPGAASESASGALSGAVSGTPSAPTSKSAISASTSSSPRPAVDPAGPGPAQVHLVGGAAGPLGGDELRCSVDLGPGARLEVRSVAASVALPGPNGRESSLEILARVGEGAALSWAPQPLIAARGARHRTFARVELAADARLVWRDELVLGRDGEEPGSVATRLRVVRDGRVLLDHEIAMGPRHLGSLGPAGSGGHRALGTVLIVEPGWSWELDTAQGTSLDTARNAMQAMTQVSAAQPSAGRSPATMPPPGIIAQDDPSIAVAVMRLSGPAVLVSAAAADGLALARVLDSALGGV